MRPMNVDQTAREIEEALGTLPMFDIHTHVVGGQLSARGLHDVLLYHMVISDLYAAGCPSGERLSQFPLEPSREEAHARLEEAVPYVSHIGNTSSSWAVRIILADLYGWKGPIDSGNWRRIDATVRERSG